MIPILFVILASAILISGTYLIVLSSVLYRQGDKRASTASIIVGAILYLVFVGLLTGAFKVVVG